MNDDLNILIVDNHKLFVAGLSRLLETFAKQVHITEKYSAAQAVSVLEEGRFDLVLIELELPSMSGLDLLMAIKARNINVRKVAISASGDKQLVQSAFQHGVNGYVPKSYSVDELFNALTQVLSGQKYIPAGIGELATSKSNRRHSGKSATRQISARQQEIVLLIQQGKTNKQIADILNIKQSTVKFHVAGLFKALGVKSRAECVHVARGENLTA